MSDKEKLVTDQTIDAYIKRLKKMEEYHFNEKGNELFIEKYVARSEQVNNLYVNAIINDFKIFNDEPKDYGTDRAPKPMETFLASIANCLEISALLYFSFAKLQIESLSVEVEGKIDKRSVLADKNRPSPGFFDIKIKWYIDSDESLNKIEGVIKKVYNNCHALGTLSKIHKFPKEIVLIGKNNAK